MGKTFISQDNLPRIPIPKLNDTCNRFIEWVEPLLNKEDFIRTKKIVEKFRSKGGDGEKLQEELIRWSERNNLSNWTAPFWYDIYLKPRHPLPINSNVFYLLKDKLNVLELSQTYIAAALVMSILKFKSLIDKEELEVDSQDGKPICMDQYRKMFSATRIPKRERDELKITLNKKYIVVLYKGNIFTVDVLEDSGETRSFPEIEEDFKHIISKSEGSDDEEIGILTTMNRDKWADARESLLQVDKRNKEYMEKIDSAIFVLCLDDEGIESLDDAANRLLHGNGRNRWFDKSLQFIVTGNGKIGINMEHTGIDGSVMVRLIKFIHEDIDKVYIAENKKSKKKPEKLKVYLNDELRKVIKDTSNQLDDFISNTQIRVLDFNKFGKDLIKTFNISPDAFVQLALQLAQYKLYGRCYSSYEAVMTRKFLHGRIEVMYCVSLESIKFIENMLKVSYDDKIKANSLLEAAKKHKARMNDCRNGRGIDTHLLGLLNMYKLFGKNIGIDFFPEVFNDKGYKILTHSTVCTSTTSTNGIELVGYGPIVDDGFGIRYLKYRDSIRFNMTSRSHIKEKLDKLIFYIEESLVEMAELMEKVI